MKCNGLKGAEKTFLQLNTADLEHETKKLRDQIEILVDPSQDIDHMFRYRVAANMSGDNGRGYHFPFHAMSSRYEQLVIPQSDGRGISITNLKRIEGFNAMTTEGEKCILENIALYLSQPRIDGKQNCNKTSYVYGFMRGLMGEPEFMRVLMSLHPDGMEDALIVEAKEQC